MERKEKRVNLEMIGDVSVRTLTITALQVGEEFPRSSLFEKRETHCSGNIFRPRTSSQTPRTWPFEDNQ